jgi:hypothetical protein
MKVVNLSAMPSRLKCEGGQWNEGGKYLCNAQPFASKFPMKRNISWVGLLNYCNVY